MHYVNMRYEENFKEQIIMYIARHSLDKEYIYDIVEDNKHKPYTHRINKHIMLHYLT